MTATDARDHWQGVYESKVPDELSWYEPVPQVSLELIEEAGIEHNAPVLELGGGASSLAGRLLDAGYTDITVADISGIALERAKDDLGERATQISWVESDVRDHDLGGGFELWHDRAVFHFMVEETDRDAYLAALRRTLSPGGHLVIATFGPNGPTRCSGLPVTQYGADEPSELLPDFKPVSSQLAVHRTPAGNPQEFLYAHLMRAETSTS